jgi:murein DD-endopeptidase MepM/ murein hydrolase activator NlpD
MENRAMKRGALVFFLLTAAFASSAAADAPITYAGEGPSEPSPQPAPQTYQEPQQLYSAPPPSAPTSAAPLEEEVTALSAWALQPNENDPRNPPRTHTVGRNESLYDIAVQYQIPIQSLIDQNRLEPPYALAPGRVIELPPPRIHIVAQGETLAQIADRYSVDRRSLALLNRMTEPYVVQPGDQIVLPALPGAWREGEPPQPPATFVPPPPAPPPPRTNETPPRGDTRFTWPVRGDVVTRFGPQAGGRRLDGIEIAAPEGAPIGAAEAGDVVYAGSDVPGYGSLVLVRHPDGFVTAYGYARRATVREGQHVRAGQTLAEVGRAADGRALMLFQVRRGASAVDPGPLLGLR